MPLLEKQKLFFLKMILENKAVLFGSFDATITREIKSATWSSILENCVEVGGFDPTNGNGWKYLRDTVWPNMRQYTVRKKDANSKTGAPGGNQMSPVDYAILDIIGKGSPALEGLSVAPDVLAIAASSTELNESSISVTHIAEEVVLPPVQSGSSNLAASSSLQQPTVSNNLQQQPKTSTPIFRRKRPLPPQTFRQKFEELKLRKMELEVEILELQRDALRKKAIQSKNCSYINAVFLAH